MRLVSCRRLQLPAGRRILRAGDEQGKQPRTGQSAERARMREVLHRSRITPRDHRRTGPDLAWIDVRCWSVENGHFFSQPPARRAAIAQTKTLYIGMNGG